MNFSLIFGCLTVFAFSLHTLGAAVSPGLNISLRWNLATLHGVRDAKLGAPMVARSLAIVHTCMYDAWAAYDDHAIGTQLNGALRRPPSERTLANKEQAISYAAYRALVDLLPNDTESVYKPLMKQLGYDPNDNSTDIETPIGIGNVACAAVLEFRHHDKSNQMGDLAQGAYSDWSGYMPVNRPTELPVRTKMANSDHWQPLTYVNPTGDLMTQRFMGAQWCYVTPFALSKGDEFRSVAETLGPSTYGSPEYREQAEELVQISGGLTDRQKMIAEYWSDGPNSEQPPGHWALFAQYVSARDHHTLDDDVKMFFALSNAIFDAGIAAWDMKRTYDSVRPATAIPFLFSGKRIRAWGGPGKGTLEMDGSHDKTPVITPGQTFNLGRNPSGKVGTVAATDADNDSLGNWQITGGTGAQLFKIDRQTGKIFLADAFHHHLDSRQDFTLLVTVSDGTNTSRAEVVTIKQPRHNFHD